MKNKATAWSFITNRCLPGWVLDRNNQGTLLLPILFGGNLEDVEHISDTDFKDTCARYVKRTNGPFPHILTPIHKQLLKSLVLWEKDQVSAQKYS